MVTQNKENHSTQEEDTYSLDSILLIIGQFGRYQVINCILISFPMLVYATASLNYVFTASPVAHRCNITECDSPSSDFYEEWISFTIPVSSRAHSKCKRFVFAPNETNISDHRNDLCYEYNFDKSAVEDCGEDLKFRDEELTISNDFRIFCSDEWKLSMAGGVNSIGQFLGVPIGGFLSDRFGRRNVLAASGFSTAIFGIMQSFSPNYYCFLVLGFLNNILNSALYLMTLVIAIELVGPNLRNFACTVVSVSFPLGEMLLALLAKYSQNWRFLLKLLHIPALLLVFYFWILPESVRWLFSRGEEEKAANILRKAAATNKRKLSDSHLHKCILANREKLKSADEHKFPIRHAFRSLFWRIANCFFGFISNTLIYYGLSLNATSLDGNKFNNFFYISLIEIPGLAISFLMLDRIGRRYSLFGCMILSGICCLITVVLSHESIWNLVLFLISKMAISASYHIIYFLGLELFPTSIRSTMVSLCSTVGRIGTVLATWTPLLGNYYRNGPMILFSIFAITSGCTSLLFPETMNTNLPSTNKEADALGSKKESVVEITRM